MKTYTFLEEELSKGIDIQADNKLGLVVFLGEEGRGRRYEKVGLFRKNPAEVINGKIMEAHPVPITINKDTNHERTFCTLAKPHNGSDKVLVRINTVGPYTRNTHGGWTEVEGEPETLVRGWGARGDAGRIGGWDDGLVTMSPGDVLEVKPEGGHKVSTYALWYDEDGLQSATWENYENLMALKEAKATIAEAEQGEGLIMAFGLMPAYTWKGGSIEKGIKLSQGATGDVVALGEQGRGRKSMEISTLGIETSVVALAMASVVVLKEEEIPARYSREEATVKVTYGLSANGEPEEGLLVRVSTQWVYTRGSEGYIKTWKGSPTILAEGYGAHGAAGRICGWQDYLVVMHEGDVFYVHPEGGYKTHSFALWVEGGKLKTQEWTSWKIADAKTDPEFYISKGTAPWGKVPADWVGRIVTVTDLTSNCKDNPIWDERETGEVISADPLVLNLGWNGQDRYDIKPCGGLFVCLEQDKQVHHLEGEERKQRQDFREKAKVLRDLALRSIDQPWFSMADIDLREDIEEIAYEGNFDIMPTTEGWYSLELWVGRAEKRIARLQGLEDSLKALKEKQDKGEVLVHFEVWHRRGGVTRQGDGWIIRPDGSIRQRDSDDVPRHKSDGHYYWKKVEEEELALKMYNGLCEVVKKPIEGCTLAQVNAVRSIEEELGFEKGSFKV